MEEEEEESAEYYIHLKCCLPCMFVSFVQAVLTLLQLKKHFGICIYACYNSCVLCSIKGSSSLRLASQSSL